MENRKPKTASNTIRTYRDLKVYQNLYKAMLIVLKEIIPRLPKEERFDLADQMRRGCKAPPALIAEGFAKRYQKRQWKKYIDDCIGECYEMMHHSTVCIDVYSKYVQTSICQKVIEIYDHSCAQLTKLKQTWQDYHSNS